VEFHLEQQNHAKLGFSNLNSKVHPGKSGTSSFDVVHIILEAPCCLINLAARMDTLILVQEKAAKSKAYYSNTL